MFWGLLNATLTRMYGMEKSTSGRRRIFPKEKTARESGGQITETMLYINGQRVVSESMDYRNILAECTELNIPTSTANPRSWADSDRAETISQKMERP
jgi:hypothetical protein